MRIKRHSLRVRLALIFAIFAVALVSILGVAFERNVTWRLRNAQETQLSQAAEQMAERLDRDLNERLQDVIQLAASDTVMSVAKLPTAQRRAELDRLQHSFRYYAWIGLTDADGRVLAANRGLLEGVDLSKRTWFQATDRQPVVLDLHEAVMLEKLIGTPSGDPLRFVDVVAPVINPDGAKVGVVAAHLSWAWAGEVQRTILGTISNLAGADILVVSRTGEVLLGPPGTRGRTLEAVSGGSRYLEARAQTRGHGDNPGLGWTVVARQPLESAFSPVRDFQQTMLVAGTLVTLLFILIGVVVAGTVAKPLEALAAASERLRLEPGFRLPVVQSGYPEVTTLAASLTAAITELQDRKAALVDLNGTLERKVDERTTEAVRAKEAAEAATRAKSEFLATMSHEVRSPLSSIIGFADLLLEDGELNHTQRRRLELIQNAGGALTCVINDILDFSKIEAGRIDLVEQPTALSALVESCAAIMEAQAEAKGVSLVVTVAPDLPRTVLADAGRLRQVLLNLLNNAVKFTSLGQVSLTVRQMGGAKDGMLHFAVTDTGIGIPQDKLGRLFQRFSQVDSSIERDYGGTGLGLAISQCLVGLMGGEITVESQVGGGSTFSFAVRLAAAADHVVAAQPAEPASTRSLHILLAEDLLANQEIVTAILAKAGHRVDVVGNGADAITAVTMGRYDVVLMDVQMPRVDGIAATRAIRGLSCPTRGVPIIAMTANVLPEQIERFKAAGMNDHIGKPIARAELMARLDAIAARAPAGAPEPAEAAPEPSDGAGDFDSDSYAELVELLGADKVAGYIQDLKQRIALFDKPELIGCRRDLGEAAHKMVGLAGMLGFGALAASCGALDVACDREDGSDEQVEAVLRAGAAALRRIATLPEPEDRADAA
jgi:signal transduction histidine kinase